MNNTTTKRQIEVPFLPEAMIQANPGLKMVLADLTKRFAPKKPEPRIFETEDVYNVAYYSHYEGSREVVESIDHFFWNNGKGEQVSAQELAEQGLGPISELELQEIFDERWHDEQQESFESR